MKEGSLGAARQRLQSEHGPVPQVHHRLEDGGQLVLQQYLLEGAPPLQVALAALDPHAGPGFVHQARDQPVRHHERVLEHEPEAHHHLAGSGQVGRHQAAELPVQVVLHPLGRRPDVGDPEPAIGALGGEEDEEGVAPLVVHGQEVGGPDVVAPQLEEKVAGHGEDLLVGAGAVVMLYLGQLRDVDEEDAQAPLPREDLAEGVQPVPIGDGLPVGLAHAERKPGEAGVAAPSSDRGGTSAPLALAAAATRLRPCRLAS